MQTGTVTHNANLRVGPGTTYAVRIVAANAAGDWYELEGGQWIAAFLVRLATAPAGTGAVASRVVSITGGDTIRVRLDGGTYPLRCILVNTPESDVPFGAEAAAIERGEGAYNRLGGAVDGRRRAAERPGGAGYWVAWRRFRSGTRFWHGNRRRRPWCRNW